MFSLTDGCGTLVLLFYQELNEKIIKNEGMTVSTVKLGLCADKRFAHFYALQHSSVALRFLFALPPEPQM